VSTRYVAVQWNARKLVYDAVAAAAVWAWLWLYRFIAHHRLHGVRALSEEVLSMRALGSCALFVLTAILCIGPLGRLDRRFAPLVYNRRHLGVMLAVVAVLHAREVLGFYYAYSDLPPVVALLTVATEVEPGALPYPIFGAAALAILVVMAATSHDFWQRTLGPRGWKSLHMLVYLAYALVVLHVAFGETQSGPDLALDGALLLSVALVGGLHFLAAERSRRPSPGLPAAVPPRWVTVDGTAYLDAGPVEALPLDEARPLPVPGGERLALVRTAGGVSAVHGVCAHQGGPLYEGRVVDGCLTCPWHGWQYRPDDGCSPPPFTEVLPTYPVRLQDGRVLVDPRPRPLAAVAAIAGGERGAK